MTRDRWIFGLALVATTAVVVGLMLTPRVEEALAPTLTGALIGVRLPGGEASEVSTDGVRAPAGSEVTLDAVLEAQRRDGVKVYYTEAPALVIDGTPIEADRVLRWDRPLTAKVRWFTIEPSRTEIEIDTIADFDALRYEEIFRPEWPQAWSVPLTVDPRFDDGLDPDRRRPPFGTVRLHARIELFGPEQQLVPVERYSSAPAEAVLSGSGEVSTAAMPTVTVFVPGALELPSAGFGLPHLALNSTEPAVVERANQLTAKGVAIALPSLLSAVSQARGIDVATAPWTEIDFVADEVGWGGDGVAEGDLLRVGARVVFLHGDTNSNGRLDPEDLSLDFAKGAALRPLGEVFGAGGVVEWLSFASAGSEDSNDS